MRFVYYHALQPLAVKAQLIKATPHPTAPAQWLSEEEVQRHVGALTATLNSLLETLFSLSYCADPALTLKCAGGLLGLAWLSRLLGTVGVCFLAFVGTLGLPKAYELKQPEADAALAKAAAKLDEAKAAAAVQGKKAKKLASEQLNKMGSSLKDLTGKTGKAKASSAAQAEKKKL